MPLPMLRLLLYLLLGLCAFSTQPSLAEDAPNSEQRNPDELVMFPSFDGQITLDAYLWIPTTPPPYSVVVAMHGCGGVFFDEPLDLNHITGKLRTWGKQLSDLGFLVVLVDSFTARGIGHEGVCSIPAEDRPPEVNATLARPFDAHAALNYVRGRSDVVPERIGLLGWSNGGTAVLSAIATAPQAPLLQNGVNIFSDPSDEDLMRSEGFAATISLYPGCGFDGGHYNGVYAAYSATKIFMGAADTTVDPITCQTRVAEAQLAGSEVEYFEYPGMGHGYDYSEWQSTAAQDTRSRTLEHFSRQIAAFFLDGFESGSTNAWSLVSP